MTQSLEVDGCRAQWTKGGRAAILVGPITRKKKETDVEEAEHAEIHPGRMSVHDKNSVTDFKLTCKN